MPIKQPGDTGPKPITANSVKTKLHLICEEFITEGADQLICKVDKIYFKTGYLWNASNRAKFKHE